MHRKGNTVTENFTKQAAKASWIASLIAGGVMIFGNSVVRSAGSSTGTLIFGGVVILLFLVGIILGIVGVFGVKKHGVMSTLVPGLIGILINGGLLALLLVIAMASSPKTREESQAIQWQEMYSEAGAFSVQMPGQPTHSSQTVDTPNGPIEVHSFLMEHGEAAYLVTYSDYPEGYAEAFDAELLLDDSRDGAVANIQGSLVQEQPIQYGAYPGRELVIEGQDNIVVHSRVYIVNSRLFQILVGVPKERLSLTPIAPFLDSFTLHTQE
jgi:hypothetical protein